MAAEAEAQEYATFLLQQSWTAHPHASMKRARYCAAAVVVDGQIVVIGGKDKDRTLSSGERSLVQINKDGKTTAVNFSPWSALPKTITPRYYFGAAVVPTTNLAASANLDTAKPRIVIAGGFNPSASDEAEMLDLSTDKWSSLPSMKLRRSGCAVASSLSLHHCGTVSGGCGGIYVVGGYNRNQRFLGDVEYISFPTQDAAKGVEEGDEAPSWKLLPSSMKQPRKACAAVVVEGQHPDSTLPYQLVVMGGNTKNGRTSSVEAYNFLTGQWCDLPPMKEVRAECAAVAVGECIYVVGGSNGKKRLASAEYFDFRTQEWTLLPNRMSKSRVGCAAAVVDEHILVLGGLDSESHYLRCVETLRVADKAQIQLPGLPPPPNAVGAMNRLRPLEVWCETVKELLAKVETDVDARKQLLERTREEKMKTLEERYRQETNKVEEEYNVNLEALRSTSFEWMRETRHRLKVAQEEIRTFHHAVNTNITDKKPVSLAPHLDVFIRDADGDRVPLNIPPDDYAALTRLAAVELNVSPDAIAKFRRTSDGTVVKSDRHMSILKHDDELEVVRRRIKAP